MDEEKIDKIKNYNESFDCSNKKILLIDDDDFLKNILVQKFNSANCIVFSSSNATEALEIIRKESFDIIILDLMLQGGMDGLEILYIIKNNPKTKNIPVVILSNNDEKDTKEKAKNLGAESFLIKAEVNSQEIIDEIKHVLSNRSNNSSN